jgi:hypothetical protein
VEDVTKEWVDAAFQEALSRAESDPLEFLFGALCFAVGFSAEETTQRADRLYGWRKQRKEHGHFVLRVGEDGE